MPPVPRTPRPANLPPARTVRVGLVQMRCGPDPARNLSRALEAVRDAAKRGAELVCLQELFRTRYFCQREDAGSFELAEPIPGPTTEALAAAARELRVAIVGSVFERRAAGVYHNTAVVLDAGGAIAGRYRKMHIPHDPCFHEKYYFTPGDTGFVCVELLAPAVRVAPLVCWDQWYPEAARLAALGGAELLVYPTAIGWLEPEKVEFGEAQLDAWETVQRAHAIANGVFVVAVNRVGTEDAIEFWGSSFVADPFGRVLARGARAQDETLVVECDLARIEVVRRDWPFLRDRRVDAYAGLERRLLDAREGAGGHHEGRGRAAPQR